MKKSVWIIGCLLLTAWSVWAGGQLVGKPKQGKVHGKIDKPQLIKKLYLKSRITNRTYKPDSFDSKTGEFEFRKLSGDLNYDICVELTDGRVGEGIDLQFVDERLIKLGEIHRKKLGLPADPLGKIKFTPQDADKLWEFVRDMEDFMDKRRILYIRHKGRLATMLVELLRDRGFHKSGGEVVWRVELWYFAKEGDNWRKLPDQEKVLRRQRLSKKQWDKIHVEYFPKWSVRINSDGTSGKVSVIIPDAPNVMRGKLGDSGFTPNTKPILVSN